MKCTVARIPGQLEVTEADMDLLVALSGFKSRARGVVFKELARKGLMAEAGVASPSAKAEAEEPRRRPAPLALHASRPAAPAQAIARPPAGETKETAKAMGDAGFDVGMAEFLDGLGLDVTELDLPHDPA